MDTRSALRNVILRIGEWTGTARRDRTAGTGRAHGARGFLVSALLFGAVGAAFAVSPAYASGNHVPSMSRPSPQTVFIYRQPAAGPQTVFIYGQPAASPQTVFIYGQPAAGPQTVFIYGQPASRL